jgi:flagellin-specific chaperone FliS
MNKTKLLKGLTQKEEKILDAIEDLQTFLDSTEDEELSSMGNELYSMAVDFLQNNDTLNIYDIRTFIEEEYDPE